MNPMYYGQGEVDAKGGLESPPLQRPAQPLLAPVPFTTPGRLRCQAHPDGDYHCLHLHHKRGAGAQCCWCGKMEKDLHGPFDPGRTT